MTQPSGNGSAGPAFLAGGGDMGARIRAHDWPAALGDPHAWPQPLRTAVRLMLGSGHPMCLMWGPDNLCIYNDAFAQVIGAERHPGSLGRPAREVWAEIWPVTGPQVEQVMSGRGGVWFENVLVPITRNGAVDDAYWTYSYSPIDDEAAPGGVGGVFVVCAETTKTVLAERAELALREQEARYHTLFNSIDQGFCVIEFLDGPQGPLSDYVHVEANPAFASHTGIPDVVGRRLREIVAPDEADKWAARYGAVLRTGEAIRFEQTLEATGRYLELSAFRVEPASRRQVAVLFQDVTARRKAEAELRANEARLSLATDTAEIGFWDADLVNGTLYWPGRLKQMFGIVTDREVTLDDFYAGLHPEDREQTRAAFARTLDPATRTLYDVEYRTVGLDDGRLRWIAAKGRGMFDASGRCVRAIGTAIDITERKRAEERLRELNEALERRVEEALAERRLLADIVETTDAYIQALDTDFRVLAINRASAAEFEYIFGVRPRAGDDLPKLLEHLPQYAGNIRAVWSRALAGESFTQIEHYDDPAHGRRHFEMTFRPLRGRDGGIEGAYQFVYDVTERVRDQQRLQEAEEHLRQAQKMEAIGQLTGGVAHDFNNLLMVITGGLSLLERQPEEARRQRIVDGMKQAAARGASLSRQLLGFARRQPLKAETVDLAAQIGAMHDLLDRALRGDVEVRTALAPDLWPIEIDPAELELAILNLCVNARDAMSQGGVIVIRADNRYGLRQGDLTGDYVELAVSDTGAGMTREVMQRAFDPFFTTKEIGKGSGLGLAQVYGFAKQSGGAAEIVSEPGAGTQVRLYLPRATGAPVKRVAKADAPAERIAGAGRVLLVEDDDEVAALIGEMLRELGYELTRAASAKAALGALSRDGAFDIVFSDVMMPGGMDGVALAREIRSRRPGLPVLLTSGYAESARARAEAEGVGLLPKPYAIGDLAVALRKAMGRA